ncbi:hypothetical protein M9458_023550, partial [Cirrhinus mrigala]
AGLHAEGHVTHMDVEDPGPKNNEAEVIVPKASSGVAQALNRDRFLHPNYNGK